MIRFSEIERYARTGPGVYEIYTVEGLHLKVGIGSNLRRRLRTHRASRQSGLRILAGGKLRPSDVISKGSILAKHLFFDEEIAPGYELRTEPGRRLFLEQRCRVRLENCASLIEAKLIEEAREATGIFRYCGAVLVGT